MDDPDPPVAEPDATGPSPRRRRALLIAGAVALAAVVLGAVAFAATRDGGDGKDGTEGSTASTAHAKGRSVPSTTSPSVAASTTTAPTTTTGAPPPPPTAPAPPPAAYSVAEAPGACRWDGASGELQDEGTVTNTGGEAGVVEVSVTWFDGAGAELDSDSDLVSLDPGQRDRWSVSALADPPAGLRCAVTIA